MTYRALIQVDNQGRPSLSENEIQHLVRVRRLSPGETFLGLHLKEAAWYECRLARKAGQWRIETDSRLGTLAESPLEIVLAAALIKKDRFEWMIQKACELGVMEIVPLKTRYVDPRRPPQANRLMDRWERILEESVKQCGRSRVPVLSPTTPLEEFLKRPRPDLRLILDPESRVNLQDILGEATTPCLPRRLMLLTGPEGGWSIEERDLFRRYAAGSIHIGPRTLRAETATLAALSIAQFLWGDVSPSNS